MNKQFAILIGLWFSAIGVFAQNAPFDIYLEPMDIPELGGLQSYAYGQKDNKWLIVGGRLDGLHRRQPWATFDVAGHNNQLLVIDPVSRQKWTAPLSSLPIPIQEQLSATNMEFYQEGDILYCLGGYGYSATLDDHTTFAQLTAIDVPKVMEAIIGKTGFEPYFRQITDPAFQVTGGRLRKIDDVFHLLGGQKFLGLYNPMGPDHGPGFVQEYTNAIRRFRLHDDGHTITISHLSTFLDSENLHRRDYNAESQILPDGRQGITMFSGVFQVNVDLPYRNAVTVDSNSYTVMNSFQQFYNHYHCAVMPLYSASKNQMHTVFFGGIAQYYDENGTLVQDNNVPFVKTIARVTREADGVMSEYKLPVELPGLLGAGAEFIPNKAIPHYSNEVLKLDQITSDSVLLGYIYGGISSSAPNVFWVNDGTQSVATNSIFKVYFRKSNLLSTHDLNEQSRGTLRLKIYPNPNNGKFVVAFNLVKADSARLTVSDVQGKAIETFEWKQLSPGEQVIDPQIKGLENGGIYLVTLETPYEKATQKVIIE